MLAAVGVKLAVDPLNVVRLETAQLADLLAKAPRQAGILVVRTKDVHHNLHRSVLAWRRYAEELGPVIDVKGGLPHSKDAVEVNLYFRNDPGRRRFAYALGLRGARNSKLWGHRPDAGKGLREVAMVCVLLAVLSGDELAVAVLNLRQGSCDGKVVLPVVAGRRTKRLGLDHLSPALSLEDGAPGLVRVIVRELTNGELRRQLPGRGLEKERGSLGDVKIDSCLDLGVVRWLVHFRRKQILLPAELQDRGQAGLQLADLVLKNEL